MKKLSLGIMVLALISSQHVLAKKIGRKLSKVVSCVLGCQVTMRL